MTYPHRIARLLLFGQLALAGTVVSCRDDEPPSSPLLADAGAGGLDAAADAGAGGAGGSAGATGTDGGDGKPAAPSDGGGGSDGGDGGPLLTWPEPRVSEYLKLAGAMTYGGYKQLWLEAVMKAGTVTPPATVELDSGKYICPDGGWEFLKGQQMLAHDGSETSTAQVTYDACNVLGIQRNGVLTVMRTVSPTGKTTESFSGTIDHGQGPCVAGFVRTLTPPETNAVFTGTYCGADIAEYNLQ
jgi:hypothetical protein